MKHNSLSMLGLKLLLGLLTAPLAVAQSIGLFLPPTDGGDRELAAGIYRAGEQAFFDFSRDDELRLISLTNRPASAEELGEVDIIVGPIYGGALEALSATESPPILSLSSDTELADAAEGRYALGLSVADEVKSPIAYACGRGIKRFALLAAADRHGRLAAVAARQAVGECGGTLVRDVTYPLPLTAKAAKKAVAEVTLGFTLAEKKAGLISSPFIRPSRASTAVIMPAATDPDHLIMLASLLPYTDKPQIQILGGRIWNHPNFRREPFARGAWFADPLQNPNHSLLAAIAYDAVALAVGSCAAASCGDGEYLTDPRGFNGKSGLFRLTANGGNERRLGIFEVTADGTRQLAVPLKTFAE